MFGTKFDMHVKNIKNIQFNSYILKINSYINFFFFLVSERYSQSLFSKLNSKCKGVSHKNY